MEVYVLDSDGNVRSFPPTLSDRGEAAFTRDSGVRWKPKFSVLEHSGTLNWAMPGKRVIVWSGSLAEDAFSRDIGTWGPRGLEALRAGVERVAEAATSGGFRVLLRPHARHVLCDVQRTLKLLHEWRELPVGLALDAASMLEVSQATTAEDHFRRAYETLGAHAQAVFVANAAVPADEEAPIRLTPLAEGLVSAERILAFLEANVAPETPRIAVFEADAPRIAAAGASR